ncbi:MAG: cobalt-precorrin-5B (C(1))-methyltransferase, partial [Desulfovibrionales bacterium]|nr:cobalt-precorrin-5B (C(1))-methyltransferase [Desulfovibrionales bacterium]
MGNKESKSRKQGAKELRSGFTTGASAAAAVRGGLIFLLTGEVPKKVFVPFIGGGGVFVPIQTCVPLDGGGQLDGGVQCTVVKDAGDDPDVTHGAVIGVRLCFRATPGVSITGGEGVGRVTQPGLDLPLGEAAINSGPRKMIHQAVADVYRELKQDIPRGVAVEVFVPEGEKLAQKTL